VPSEPTDVDRPQTATTLCPAGDDDASMAAGSDANTDDDGWRAVFGHDDPYDAQVDGIETAVSAAREEGFTVVEGACGTGKTMLALTAGVHLVRDPASRFERVLVLTSVKQQLRQFEADLQRINDGLPAGHDPVSALTLVGKADVCPYEREGTGGFTEASVYERCESLRERTSNLNESNATSAADLASRARSQQTGLGEAATYLESAGEAAPYASEVPEFEDTEFCPFYATYLDDRPDDGDADPLEAVPFDVTDQGLIDTEDLVALSMRHGTCPHSMMGLALSAVEVVVGNYYHAFDPTTVATFTAPLIDESTFVVCDEAHMLEPRVRELVSDRVADRSLRDAESELTRVIQPLALDDGDPERPGGRDRPTGVVSGPDTVAGDREQTAVDTIRAELEDASVSRAELEATREFVRDLREELDRRVSTHLDGVRTDWSDALAELRDDEIPLRDPNTPGTDELSGWAAREGYDGGAWVRAEAVGAFVGRVLNELEENETKRTAPGVGRSLANWYRFDNETYFREIELERTWDDTQPRDSWRRAYNARYLLHNCLPADPIGDRLADFGGGVLMSATLEPLDVFEEVTGLDRLREEEQRPVVSRTYGLHFSEENRASFAVAAPKFTYDNRGPTPRPTGDRDDGPPCPPENATRRAHYDAVREVATGPGNVLVGMPSYAEAEWMAGLLDRALEKPVLLDESTAEDVTRDLKTRFFGGDGKVLVTSLRGTLTEGVDYRGDRLRAAVVCGVPIINTASPRTEAVRTTYDRAFGDGFRYALTVPAVRKARQAVGRVIRGPEETGVRVLVDERYARDSWDSVTDLLPEHEGFRSVSPDMLSFGLDGFWSDVG
jgi:DNA excision repair protein ERCC-2